jgi:hypothetical protein
MRNHDDVTDEELKAAYDNTPAVNQYVPWAEVKANPTFKTLLINQIIAHEEEQTMEKLPTNNGIFLAIDNGKKQPVFIGMDVATKRDTTVVVTTTEPKLIKRRSTITLHQGQIEKIKTALTLSRNCLKYGGMSDVVRNEALDSLAESQKIIQSFYERG